MSTEPVETGKRAIPSSAARMSTRSAILYLDSLREPCPNMEYMSIF